MKKTTIPISFDEEKTVALKLYLEQKGMKMEDELVKSVEALYMKTVPAGVRDFIELRSGNGLLQASKQTPKVKSANVSTSRVNGEEEKINSQ